MAATTITNVMLNALREQIVDIATYGFYRIGTTWYSTEINSKAVQSNGAVHITFYIESHGADLATEFRLTNASGEVLASRVEDVPFVDGAEKMLYRFKFGVSVGG